MKIELDIPADRIAQLFSSAIEGGDPVTTASKGGWCDGIDWHAQRKPKGPHWYAEADNFPATGFALKVIEIDDETTGHKSEHVINQVHVRKGLEKMATAFPDQFGQIMRDNIDAPCADIFLQCVLFGEEKYA